MKNANFINIVKIILKKKYWEYIFSIGHMTNDKNFEKIKSYI